MGKLRKTVKKRNYKKKKLGKKIQRTNKRGRRTVKKYVKNRRRTIRGGIFKKGWNISKGTANMLGLRTPSKDRIDNDQGKGQETSLNLDEVFYTRKLDDINSMFESGNKVLFDELKEKMILAMDLLIKCKQECLEKCNTPCSEENCKEKEDLCKDIIKINKQKPNYAAPNFCNQYLTDSENCRDYLRLLQRLIEYRKACEASSQVSVSFEELKKQLDFFSDSVKDLPFEFSLEEKKKAIEDLQYHESPWRDVSTAESENNP